MHILELLNIEMNKPIAYESFGQSWFHYLSLLLTILLSLWSIKYLKHKSIKQVKAYMLVFSLILITFEIYKQIIFTYQNSWDYMWYIFPFQFCSIPMYVGLVAGLTRSQKIFDASLAFLATYGLFAGIAVMLYPSDVFVTTMGINIQTMVHHGGMVIVGIALIYSGQVKLNLKSFFKAASVFSIVVTIAVLLNTIHNTWINEPTFNMFFINPKYGNHLPILSSIEPLVNGFIFVIIYYLGFSMVALIVYLMNLFMINKVDRDLKLLKKLTPKKAI